MSTTRAATWLEMLEEVAEANKRATHEFKDSARLDIERHTGCFFYYFTPAGSPTNEVDRDTALRILGSEV